MSTSPRRLLTGWGRTAPTAAAVERPSSATDAAEAVRAADGRGVIARGLGRSYNDAAQSAGGTVLDCTGLSRILDFDGGTGHLTVAGGTSLDTLMRSFVPLGWFVPVTPGTRHVTVGGAIAADIHGKNHHKVGSFCQHVVSLRLLVPSGEVLDLSPDATPAEFWATAGGMGLTGVILDATVRMTPIESSRLAIDTDRTTDLDDCMARMTADDDRYGYSVAWIDLMARGRHMGRSVLTRGDFATLDQLPDRARRDPLAFHPHVVAAAPPWAPPHLLNRLTVAAFNEFWYRKAPKHREGELQSIPAYFHPLDMVVGWNRLYGRPGFVQWQCAVPEGTEDTVRRLVTTLSAARCTSFLAVLKHFGEGNPGPLSFPMPGWTLALDIPNGDPSLRPLLDELDRAVVDAGGRVYLAKDARVRPDVLHRMYPDLDVWRKVRDALDPDGKMANDLSRRLGLVGPA